MTPLREAMIRAMQMRGFSQRTHHSYLTAVTDLAHCTKRSPCTVWFRAGRCPSRGNGTPPRAPICFLCARSRGIFGAALSVACVKRSTESGFRTDPTPPHAVAAVFAVFARHTAPLSRRQSVPHEIQSPIYKVDCASPHHPWGRGIVQHTFIRRARNFW